MTPPRLQSIDFVRGLVILIMTVDHVREFFYFAVPLPDPMDVEKVDLATFVSRVLAHFCAPVFVFLTGLSACLSAQRRELSPGQLSRFLLERGLLFALLEVTLINFAWTFSFPPEKVFLQVIWAIGVSLICLAGFVWLPWTVQLGTALTIIFGHNLLDSYECPPGTLAGWSWAVLHERQTLTIAGMAIRTSYPVLPWVGVMLLGFVCGRWFQQAQQRHWLLWTGLSVTSLFIAMRFWGGYGEPNIWNHHADNLTQTTMEFFNLTKYPPSLLFILMTLGPALVVLHYAQRALPSWWYRAVETFGRVPFFYYVLHLYFLHVAYRLCGMFMGYDWYGHPLRSDMPARLDVGSIWAVWLISLITVALLYPVIALLAKLKGTGRFKLLRYF